MTYFNNVHIEYKCTVNKTVLYYSFDLLTAAIDWVFHDCAARRLQIFEVMAPIRFPIISDNQMDKYLAAIPDKDLSVKIALQKILNDFKGGKKTISIFETKLKSSALKPYHLVPRQCSRKNIYICGGFSRPSGGRWSDSVTLSTVERYDTYYKTWHVCPSLQFNRSALGAGVINGQVCVVGGENDLLILDSVETYDPVTYEWMGMPGMISPR